MNGTPWHGKLAGAAAFVIAVCSHAGVPAQEPANDPSPLVLPGHRYDLPATLITAAQIEQHKQNMIAVKETDVAMTMVKAGGAPTSTRWGSAWSSGTRDKRIATTRSMTTWRRSIT